MKIALLIIAIAALETTAFAQPSAEDLYTEGQAAYDRAHYATAVGMWQAAYDLSKESGLLFNLAQAKRLSGDCAGANATYRHFLATDADDTAAEQHKLAADLARELEALCPTPAQKPAVIPPPKLVEQLALNEAPRRSGPQVDSARPGRTWKIAGLTTGGVGIVTIAIGLGLGHHGASIGDEVTSACRVSCDWEAQKAKDARGRREVTIGNTLDVIGAAAIAGGAIFYYLGVRQATLTAAPAQGGGGGVISWSSTW